MIADNPVDILCLIIWSIAGGMLIGAHWTRKEWIKACLQRKLIRFDRATGRLLFACDRGEVP